MYTDTRTPSDFTAEDIHDHTEEFPTQHWSLGNEVIPCDSMSEPMLPYESFLGAFLTPNYRIRRFLRTESHGEVYSVESLSHPGTELEAKLYIMNGLSEKLFKYRRRNLKRLELKDCYVETVWQRDRCIVVCYASACASAVSEKLGACGRTNTAEFDRAFPPLPKTDGSNLQDHGYGKTLLVQDLERIFKGNDVYDPALYHRLQSFSLTLQRRLEEAGKTYRLLKAKDRLAIHYNGFRQSNASPMLECASLYARRPQRKWNREDSGKFVTGRRKSEIGTLEAAKRGLLRCLIMNSKLPWQDGVLNGRNYGARASCREIGPALGRLRPT